MRLSPLKSCIKEFWLNAFLVPHFSVYNFFRQNIWHSIFDQFHFHHIFGDEMTVSSDKTSKGTSRPPSKLRRTPPSCFLPISPNFLMNIKCRYFSLDIWVAFNQLKFHSCVFDQNWAKTRPLHFQIFQILNATDSPIVHWGKKKLQRVM